MKRLLALFIVTMCLASPAFAADFAGCQVVEIVLSGEQNAHVQLSCQVSNAPACAAARNYVAFDKTTTGGKHYLAMFMSAQAMNASVEGFVDPNSCPAWQANVALLTHLRVRR